MIGQTISHYKILSKLGEGGMGVVYKAEDIKLKRTVALKFLPPELTRDKSAKTRFIHEAQAASALQHHNICTIHEIDETKDGRLFICMDCYDGETLKEKIARGPLPIKEAVNIAMQVAEGLSEAHEAGIVHRDIKPGNILVSRKGVVKIVDFGLAKLAGMTKVTRTGTAVGTISYMSPEQARGQETDRRSDIWSVGVVLYEMVTGRPPFAGEHEAAVLYQITNEEPQPVTGVRTGVPVELDRIIRKALSPRVTERYQTVDDMGVDLRRLEKELEIGGSVSWEKMRGVVKREGRRWWRIGIPVAVAIALAAVAVWWFVLKPPSLGANTIVVLPFEVRGPDETDPEFVGRAFAEAVAIELSQVKELEVRPPDTGSGEGAAKSEDVNAVIERSRVRYLVRGRLDRSDQGVTCQVTLTDDVKRKLVWGSTLRGGAKSELSTLAATLAREVGRTLGHSAGETYVYIQEFVGLPEYRNSPLMAETVQAWENSDQGALRELSGRLLASSPGSLEPRVLRMWWWGEEYYRVHSRANRDSLTVWIGRVDATDVKNPYGSLMNAWLSYNEGHTEDAIREYTLVLDRPDLSVILRAFAYRRRAYAKSNRDPASALSDLEEMARIAPTYSRGFDAEAEVLRKMGRLDEAERKAREAVALVPDNSDFRHTLGLVLSDEGDYEGAAKELRRSCESNPGDPINCTSYAIALWLAGRCKEALARIDEQERLNVQTPNGWRAYQTACFWAVAGDPGKAKAALRRAIDLGKVTIWIASDPDLKSLHGDPEFETMVTEVKRKMADTEKAQGR